MQESNLPPPQQACVLATKPFPTMGAYVFYMSIPIACLSPRTQTRVLYFRVHPLGYRLHLKVYVVANTFYWKRLQLYEVVPVSTFYVPQAPQ